MYTISVANEKIIGINALAYSESGINYPIQNIEVSEEIYNNYLQDSMRYIFQNGEIIENPDFEICKALQRKYEFYSEFFETSLGNIRRKVSMKTGEIKDFLTDLLPAISISVNSGQNVNIITYKTPDFYTDISEYTHLQEIKQVTPEFIQECFVQLNKDFAGI